MCLWELKMWEEFQQTNWHGGEFRHDLSVPNVSKLSSSMNGKLGPITAAGDIWICPMVEKEFYTVLMTLLRGNQQRRGQICSLRVYIGTLKKPSQIKQVIIW